MLFVKIEKTNGMHIMYQFFFFFRFLAGVPPSPPKQFKPSLKEYTILLNVGLRKIGSS